MARMCGTWIEGLRRWSRCRQVSREGYPGDISLWQRAVSIRMVGVAVSTWPAPALCARPIRHLLMSACRCRDTVTETRNRPSSSRPMLLRLHAAGLRWNQKPRIRWRVVMVKSGYSIQNSKGFLACTHVSRQSVSHQAPDTCPCDQTKKKETHAPKPHAERSSQVNRQQWGLTAPPEAQKRTLKHRRRHT
ncbi:hypothetical protein N657DRAFT_271749 [Parathielavia appendiculata]|uniref:Uncharacterized protein n=1 Tax=Parathielavia appendiculata TaxID=2587402 RepID=A0AAN6Z5A1_9PEZI|nr:hypothetical protein N657DRAFT_271749 [Parathielavia appendiculata]